MHGLPVGAFSDCLRELHPKAGCSVETNLIHRGSCHWGNEGKTAEVLSKTLLKPYGGADGMEDVRVCPAATRAVVGGAATVGGGVNAGVSLGGVTSLIVTGGVTAGVHISSTAFVPSVAIATAVQVLAAGVADVIVAGIFTAIVAGTS